MGSSPKFDNSAAEAAAKEMRQATERMIRENQYQSDAQRLQNKKEAIAQAQQMAPLQMIQPPQQIQQPVQQQVPQSQSVTTRTVANPQPQGSYGSAQQAKMAAIGAGGGAAGMMSTNVAKPTIAVSPSLNSFNAPEVNNIKFGGA